MATPDGKKPKEEEEDLPKSNSENRQTGWVRILQKCLAIFVAAPLAVRYVIINDFVKTTLTNVVNFGLV